MNAARLVNGILWRMEKFFSRTRIRWFKTLYINFRTLPFSQAIRLPIYMSSGMTCGISMTLPVFLR